MKIKLKTEMNSFIVSGVTVNYRSNRPTYLIRCVACFTFSFEH